MVVTLFDNKLFFCSVCVKAKMARQPHRKSRIYIIILEFWIHADDGGGRDTYATFCKFFILSFLFVKQLATYG